MLLLSFASWPSSSELTLIWRQHQSWWQEALTWVVDARICIKAVFRGKINLDIVRCSKDFWEIMWDKVCKYERIVGADPPRASSLSQPLNPLPSYSSLNWTVPLFRLILSPYGLKLVCDGIGCIWEDSIKMPLPFFFFLTTSQHCYVSCQSFKVITHNYFN